MALPKVFLLRVVIVVFLCAVAALLFFNYKDYRSTVVTPQDFNSCLSAGYPIMESYPRRCSVNGVIFVEDIGNTLSKDDMIRVIEPLPNTLVSFPLMIVGTARGSWFNEEGEFAIEYGASGSPVLGYAKALDDWTTEQFVPFRATVSAPSSATGTITLVFRKQNSSGLPDQEDFLSFPVIVQNHLIVPESLSTTTPVSGCVISGCSSELCGETTMASNCMYKPEFACYRDARCERQPDGVCGWTDTPALRACLANPGDTL